MGGEMLSLSGDFITAPVRTRQRKGNKLRASNWSCQCITLLKIERSLKNSRKRGRNKLSVFLYQLCSLWNGGIFRNKTPCAPFFFLEIGRLCIQRVFGLIMHVHHGNSCRTGGTNWKTIRDCLPLICPARHRICTQYLPTEWLS